MQAFCRRLVAACAALSLLACSALLSTAGPAHASQQPVRLIIPFTAGSGTDVVGRTLADRLQQALGVPVVVENRPGAGGTVGAAAVANAAPDGKTILLHSAGHVVNPAIYPNLPYDVHKDFVPVAMVAMLPNVLVVPHASPIKNVDDLIRDARARPGQATYGSAGNGSATHMNAEKFRLAVGIDAVHVPFRGTPESVTEIMAGRLDWGFFPIVSVLPMVKSDKLRAVAVGTPQRAAALPEVPTTSEAGYPDAAYTFWMALFAPAGTPAETVERLHTEVTRIQNDPAFRSRLLDLGAETVGMPQPEFAAFVERDAREVAELVKRAGMRAD